MHSAYNQPHVKRKSKARCIFLSYFTFHAWPIHRKNTMKSVSTSTSLKIGIRVVDFIQRPKSQMLHNFIDCMLNVYVFFVRMHAYDHMFFGMWPLLNCWAASGLHAMHKYFVLYIWSESSIFRLFHSCWKMQPEKETKWNWSKTKNYRSTKRN